MRRGRHCSVTADGTEVFDIDITEYLYMGMGSMADLQIFTDEEGVIYVSDNTSYVWVFDKEGNHTADIALPSMQGFAVAVNILPDGRPGVIYQGNSMQIAALTDGRIAAYSSDWSTNTNTLILMEGVVVPKTAAKEVLTLACMNYASPFLRAAVRWCSVKICLRQC